MLPGTEIDRLALERGDGLEAVQKLFPGHASQGFMESHRRFWGKVYEVTPESQPDPLAFVVFRGGGKSTTAEMSAVVLVAQKRRKFILYVSETQPQANAHVQTIQGMLESEEVQRYYPEVGRPKLGYRSAQKAWRSSGQAELQLENGAVILALGLDTASRGIKKGALRPDAIILDDIDDRGHSPETVRSILETLGSKILPTRAPNCFIVFVQNMIHSYSVMTQVVRKTGFLANRHLIGPIPAVIGCEIEHAADRDDGRDVIVAGEAAWPERMPIEACQAMLDEGLLEFFLAEYQHDVDRTASGAVYPTWDPKRHIATWDELAALIGYDEVYNEAGEVSLTPDWSYVIGLDWGATMGHRAVAALWATPPARFDVFEIDDMWFRVGELCRPRTEADLPDMTAEMFGELILDEWFSLTREFRPLRFPLDRLEGAFMSHERLTERNTFCRYLSRPIQFAAFSGGATGGIEQMRTALRPNPKQPHPLRRYPAGYRDPKTHEDLSGAPLMGRPGVIWLVANGHGELEVGEETEMEPALRAREGKGDLGMARGREEYPVFHYVKEVASGLERLVPFNKALNDACDADRMVGWAFFARQAPLDAATKIKRHLDKHYPIAPSSAPETGVAPDPIEVQHMRVMEHRRMKSEMQHRGGPRRLRGGMLR